MTKPDPNDTRHVVWVLCSTCKCQNSRVPEATGSRVMFAGRSFWVNKIRLQLVCCALVQDPGCLGILEGRKSGV